MAGTNDPILVLLDEINQGGAATALPKVEAYLAQIPNHPGLLCLKAEALRLSGKITDAILAYRIAGALGGGARNWQAAGALLTDQKRVPEALFCLKHALSEAPDDEEVLHTFVVTCFNTGNAKEALSAARHILAIGKTPKHLAEAALLMEHLGLYEESMAVFKRLISEGTEDLMLIGTALIPSRYTCEWAFTEHLENRLLACYAKGKYHEAREYPGTHIAWCKDEKHNLAVTQCHLERFIPASSVKPKSAVAPKPTTSKDRIRVGYLSCDFHNHATMHLMAGVFEQHDKSQFEIFAYGHGVDDGSFWRQRFLNAVEHHIDVSQLTDLDAAARIEADDLDILIDLKGHTGMARLEILAHKPAPLQASYLGYPGSVCSNFLDYVITDRFVTPDSSIAYYTEKLCRLPHSYQCNDNKRPIAVHHGGRAFHNLPEDKVVFVAFNQSRKIDRVSFDVWLSVLKQVPNSILWLLKQSEMAERNLTAHAASFGITADRFLFADFLPPEHNLARLALADAALDTLTCNGHTTTSDALWAGTPVVTARGTHFASRVSESLLNAMNLPELVGKDTDEMIKIAVKIGKNKKYREALRKKVSEGRALAPLFDTERFTRNFEKAIVEMVSASRKGDSLPHLDMTDARS